MSALGTVIGIAIYRPDFLARDAEIIAISKELHNVCVMESIINLRIDPRIELYYKSTIQYPIATLSPSLQQYVFSKGFIRTDYVEVPFKLKETMQRISDAFFDVRKNASYFKWESLERTSSLKKPTIKNPTVIVSRPQTAPPSLPTMRTLRPINEKKQVRFNV